MLDELARWGVETSSSTRPAPRRTGSTSSGIEAPSNPFLTMPSFEAASGAPRARRLRRNRGDAAHRPAARARLRPRRSTRRRSTSRATTTRSRRRRLQASRATPRDCWSSGREPAPVAAPDTAWLRPTRLSTLEAACSLDRPERHGYRRGLRLHTRPCEVVRYPGFGGLLSFDVADAGRGPPVETSTTGLRQHDEPGRGHVANRGAGAGRRAGTGRPSPPLRRPRGPGRALDRPHRAGARERLGTWATTDPTLSMRKAAHPKTPQRSRSAGTATAHGPRRRSGQTASHHPLPVLRTRDQRS